MDFRRLCLFSWLILICVFPASSKDITKSLVPISSISPLAKDQGYLVVYVDVGGIAPSIEFSKVKARSSNIFSKSKKLKLSNTYSIDLKGLKKGFYYVPILEGTYQITRVNTPFYDLPYWLPTENAPRWRFSIHKEAFNFIGELKIAKERYANVIDVNLYNRIATHQEALKNEMKQVSGTFSLMFSPGYRDEFFEELQK